MLCVSVLFNRERETVPGSVPENGSGGSGSAFGSWENTETVPTVPLPVPVWFLDPPERLEAPYRAILRYYRCDTPYCAIVFKGVY